MIWDQLKGLSYLKTVHKLKKLVHERLLEAREQNRKMYLKTKNKAYLP